MIVGIVVIVPLLLALVRQLTLNAPADDSLPVEPLEWSGAVRRKREAKRFNEHAKLLSTFLNNLGIASLVTVAIAPVASSTAPISWPRTLLALVIASMLHIFAQGVLRLWKSEE